MKKMLLFFLTFCLMTNVNAQYETLVLNYEKSCFGENEPLPTRQNFIVTGVINNNINYVEVNIYAKKGVEKGDPIYSTFWKKSLNSKSLNFSIPINFNLRESKEYDIEFKFYKPTDDIERKRLYKELNEAFGMYISQAFKVSDKELELVKSEKRVVKDLNKITLNIFSRYRTRTSDKFEGFSELVSLKLDQLDDVKLTKIAKDSKADQRMLYRNQLLEELNQLLNNEVGRYINADLSIMVDDKYINDYPTEKTQNYLPLNIGYGGAMFSTDFNNFNYGSAPYAGLSIPFGKEGGRSEFWSRSSLSVGAFLSNISDQDGVEYTGPIFKIPVYASLGYRAYRFVRVNAGASFLENTSNGSLEIVPFVGLSLEFNIAVKLAN